MAYSNITNYNNTTKLSKATSYKAPTTFLVPDNYIYISHLDEDFRFWRLPCTPDSIQDSMQSTFTSTSALARSAPVYTYNNSGPRSVTINLKFHRDMMDDYNIGASNSVLADGEDYTENLIHALQSIALPAYNLNNAFVSPPMVAVRLANEVFIKGIVNGGINTTYALPILSNNKYAQVEIGFTVYEIDPYSAAEVYRNGSFRGMTNTLRQNMGIDTKTI